MTAPDLSPAEAKIVARFDAAPTLPEDTVERVAAAIAATVPGAPGPTPLTRRMAVAAIDALKGPALAVFRGQQDPAVQRVESVDQLTREHFGEWVDVPDRQAGGYLYVVRDEFHDGYPSRYLVLVHDDGTGDELEFTDSDPIQYPKTMRTPCTIRAAIGGDGR